MLQNLLSARLGYPTLLGCMLFPLTVLVAQKEEPPIVLNNPSFEGTARAGIAGGGGPYGWQDCGKPGESAPDIQPGAFQVTKAPNHGNTYLGMVVRDNDTWESVSQRLSVPLEVNKCYEMTLDLCNSKTYISQSRTTGQQVNYSVPVKLRFYGGNGSCARQELLYETPLVTNERWLMYYVRLKPKNASYNYLVIEAYYQTPVVFPYNGNVLVDNLSPIQPVPCKPPVVAAASPRPVKPPTAKPRETPGTDSGVAVRGDSGPKDTVVKLAMATPPPPLIKRDKLVKGSIIRLHNILFEVDRYDIKDSSIPTLDGVFAFLQSNPDVTVEVGGHTNNRPSDSFAETLSTNRAKAVADWLVSKGVDQTRITYKGYGKKFPIANNTSEVGLKRNQRVEIKIIDISK
jgi:outer membrane protein OmpA-like peptidoglycan-associated protein